MQENENILPDTCNFRDVQPIMMNLPYPADPGQEEK